MFHSLLLKVMMGMKMEIEKLEIPPVWVVFVPTSLGVTGPGLFLSALSKKL